LAGIVSAFLGIFFYYLQENLLILFSGCLSWFVLLLQNTIDLVICKKIEIYFLQFWKLRSPRSRGCHVARTLLLCYPMVKSRGKKETNAHRQKCGDMGEGKKTRHPNSPGTYSLANQSAFIHEPSWLNHLLKVSPLNTAEIKVSNTWTVEDILESEECLKWFWPIS
jgi:hypothetical protein